MKTDNYFAYVSYVTYVVKNTNHEYRKTTP